MKKLLIIMLATVAFCQMGDSTRYTDWKASFDTRGAKDIISTRNDYVAVQLERSTTGDYGRFNIGTRDGRSLTYNYPMSPWSSWFSIILDGQQYLCPGVTNSGGPDVEQLEQNPEANFAVFLWPSNPDSNFIYGGWRVRSNPRVKITQKLQPVYLVYPDDTTGTVFIKYVIYNRDYVSHQIGANLMLDTKIADNDWAEISSILGYRGIEEQFYNCDTCVFPCFWYAYEDSRGPAGPVTQLRAMGILCGYDAVEPTRFAYGNWPCLFNVNWTLTPSGSPIDDSAVLMTWWPRTIAPGESLVVATYFGLGQPPSGAVLDVRVPQYPEVLGCEGYDPNPFTVMCDFINLNAFSLNDVTATITLPAGLSLVGSYVPSQRLDPEDLPAMRTGSTGWEIRIADGTVLDENDSICVRISSITLTDTTFYKCLNVRLRPVGRPQVSAISPLSTPVFQTTSCGNLEVRAKISAPNGFSSLRMLIDGATITYPDSRLRFAGDTLIFTPSTPWENNRTHRWSVPSFADSVGCLSNAVADSFFADTRPPDVWRGTPAGGSILAPGTLDRIFALTHDYERAVDTAEITITVGDAEPIPIASTFFDKRTDTLLLRAADAGFVFEDNDTVCCYINGVADLPLDICDPNSAPEYSWCFYFHSIDFWLPETSANLGDIIDIPVLCEDLTNFHITNLALDISFFAEMLTPLEIIVDDAVAESWGFLSWSTVSPGRITISGSGPALPAGDTLCYIRFFVNSARGSFSRLDFNSAAANGSAFATQTHNGYLFINWESAPWSGSIFFFTKNIPMTHLTYGATESTSALFDVGYDIPRSSSAGYDAIAWFELNDPAYPAYDKLLRSYQDMSDTLIFWWAKSIYASRGDTVVAFWNRTTLPEGIFLLSYTKLALDSVSLDTFFIDMKADTYFVFSDSTNITITFLRSSLHRCVVDVCLGWNLLSLPTNASASARISEIIPGALSDGFWYNPATRGYDLMTYPAAEKAFWVFSLTGEDAQLFGMTDPITAIRLSQRWNMVGVPYTAAGYVDVADLITMPEASVLSIFGYDCATTNYYAVTDRLEVGRGYWVFAIRDCNMLIGETVFGKFFAAQPDDCLELNIEGQKLWVCVDDQANEHLDDYDVPAPPAPPDSKFNLPALVCGDELLIRDVRPKGSCELDLPRDVLVSWSCNEHSRGYLLERDGIIVDMTECGEFYASAGTWSISRVEPRNLNLAAVPNPFNASTELTFTLPSANEVTLSVFDISGKCIAELYKGELTSGVHIYVWRGDNQPSGVYFARLSLPDASYIRRLVLLK